ncbi:MAG: hypothetical protein K8T26_14180 [Lentisphaerae bacterium]|nr:hypothetical protein [Lentisphaerota bacterium]
MAITISKKKPLVLKQADEGQEVGEVATFAPPDFITAGREPSYTLSGVFAIVAVLFVVILLLFQWLEMQEYDKPPAAFLPPGAAAAP